LADHARAYRARRKKKYRNNVAGMDAAYPMPTGRPRKIDIRHRDKREAKIKAGHVTEQELKEIVKRDGGKCIYCLAKVKTSPKPYRVRGFDHLFPLLSDEGEHAAWNMAVCCLSCNGMKQQKTFLEFVEDEGLPLKQFEQIPWVHFGLDEPIDLEDEDDFYD
jgi:5-methylcytosine-specific restriction endonuclease McrA